MSEKQRNKMSTFNGYYDYKDPVGFDTIRKQKEDLGYKDETFIEEGKGVVAGESIYQSVGFKAYDSTKTYAKNAVVEHDGKLYSAKDDDTTGDWDSEKWTEETPETLKGSNT